MINNMRIPEKLAIQWVIDTKAISPFTRNFIEWLYKNDFAIINEGLGDINLDIGEKMDKYGRFQ